MAYFTFKATCSIGRRLHSSVTPLRISSHNSLLTRIQSSNNVQLPVTPFDPKTPCRATSTNSEAPHKYDEEVLVPFFLQYPSTSGKRAAPLGFLRPSVANALLEDHHSQPDASGRSCWSFHGKDQPLTGSLSKNDMWALSFSPHIRSEALRTQAVTRLVEKWRSVGMFPDILKGEGLIVLACRLRVIQYLFRLESRSMPCIPSIQRGESRRYQRRSRINNPTCRSAPVWFSKFRYPPCWRVFPVPVNLTSNRLITQLSFAS